MKTEGSQITQLNMLHLIQLLTVLAINLERINTCIGIKKDGHNY
jgi:hypothetical protein